MNPVSDELSEVVRVLESAPYRFAVTMPSTPHYYTLKRERRAPQTFAGIVESMRKFERLEYYAPWKKENPYLFANGYRYWTMGASADETILINRDVFYYDSPFYNGVASGYDKRFSDAESVEESKREFGKLPFSKGDRILDIGCGTGMLLDYRHRDIWNGRYVGIDPSLSMLQVCALKHPNYRPFLRCTTFEDYVPPPGEKYALIVAMFGAASYFTDPDAMKAKAKSLLDVGGTAIFQFNTSKPRAYQGVATPPPAFDGLPDKPTGAFYDEWRWTRD